MALESYPFTYQDMEPMSANWTYKDLILKQILFSL